MSFVLSISAKIVRQKILKNLILFFSAFLEPVHVKVLPATDCGAHNGLCDKVWVTVATGTTVFQIAMAIWGEGEEERERREREGKGGEEEREREERG